MKKYTILFFIVLSFNAIAQKPKTNKLIGVWQVSTAQLADAWFANYRFYKDGTFKYSFNSYEDRGRIKSAKGSYKLNGDTLTIIVMTRSEWIGGDLVGGSAGFQQEELVLDGGKMIEVKQKIISPIYFTLKWFVKAGIKGFQLQNNKYYLVSTDPHNQED